MATASGLRVNAPSSVTTFLFTDYSSKANSDWKSKVGANTAVEWPVGLGALKGCFRSLRCLKVHTLCPYPPFGPHKGLTESVQLGLYLCRVQHGALNFLAHQLGVPLA